MKDLMMVVLGSVAGMVVMAVLVAAALWWWLGCDGLAIC